MTGVERRGAERNRVNTIIEETVGEERRGYDTIGCGRSGN